MIWRIEINVDGHQIELRNRIFALQTEAESCLDALLERHFDATGTPVTWQHVGYSVDTVSLP